MPIYDYLCNDCKKEFVNVKSVKDRAKGRCSYCGSENVKKLISAFNTKWNGRGWDLGEVGERVYFDPLNMKKPVLIRDAEDAKKKIPPDEQKEKCERHYETG